MVVVSFSSVLRRTHWPPITVNLKTPGDKGAVDLLYLGVLWGGKVIGKAPESLCSYVTKGYWSQKLSRSDGPQSWISVLL